MSLSFLSSFLHSQLFVTLPVPSKDRTGETIIVTGANTGLGFEAARHFARLNASKVILACRSTEKGEQAANDIIQTTDRARDTIEVWPLDLSSYDSVVEFAKRASNLPRLDAVLENAGLQSSTHKVAEQDELTLTVNVVSTFLLALLLLPKLRETAKKVNQHTHLSIVSSEAHFFVKDLPEAKQPKIFEELSKREEGQKYFTFSTKASKMYPISKLLEVFYVKELAKHAQGDDVIINCMNPGLCHSEFNRENIRALEFMKLLLARSTEAGSRTLVDATEEGPESHGEYLSNCQLGKVSPYAASQDGAKAQQLVYTELNGKLENIVPGITKQI